MRQLLACLIVVLSAATGANAFDVEAVQRLLDNNHCERCDLSDADLGKAELTGAGLSGANLSNANLQKAILIGATLDRAELRGADLRGALLEGTKFGRASLTDAKLDGAKLSGADLSRTVGLTQSQLDSACKDKAGDIYKTLLPSGLSLRPCK